jgi:toxin FitB
MIILDTNVASEMMKARPAAQVLAWLNAQPAALVFVTAPTRAEIFFGIELLAAGRKREGLHRAASEMFQARFTGRLLSFDGLAADAFAVIAAERRRLGRPIGIFDCQIAAIARTQGAKVATRDLRDFENCGVELIDPWSA